MRVYLSNPYGTIPGEDWREYRFYLLAKSLAARGHEVVWFTSTFSHHFKNQRSPCSKVISIDSNLKIHLVKSSSYRNNFSIGRIFRDFTYGLRLTSILKHEYSKPDLFFNGDSPILFYYPSYWYCRKNKIPFIIDQMDLWPELIINSFPYFLRPIINLMSGPIFFMRRSIFNQSVGFMSLAKRYLDVPMNISKRLIHVPTAVVYNGIDVAEFRYKMSRIDDSLLEKLGFKGKDEIWFIFAGTLGPSYDLRTILMGFKNLTNQKYRLLIAGDGSSKGYVEDFIKNNNLGNVTYIGKISKESLPYLYSMCDVGLNAYGPYSNVEMSDKFYDYTAAGLAVLNSLEGEVNKLVIDNSIGLNYLAGDLLSFEKSLNEIIDGNKLIEYKINSYRIGLFFDQQEQMRIFSDFFQKVSLVISK